MVIRPLDPLSPSPNILPSLISISFCFVLFTSVAAFLYAALLLRYAMLGRCGGTSLTEKEKENEWPCLTRAPNCKHLLAINAASLCLPEKSFEDVCLGGAGALVLAERYGGHPCETLVASCISALHCSSHLLWIPFQPLRLSAGLSVLRCSISPHQQAVLAQTPGCAKMGFTPIKSPLECALNGMIQCAAFVRGCLNIIVVGGMKFGGPAGRWRPFSSLFISYFRNAKLN